MWEYVIEQQLLIILKLYQSNIKIYIDVLNLIY